MSSQNLENVGAPGPGILGLSRTRGKIVSESFSWLLFTLCELKNAAAFVLKHSLWEPQNLAFAFWENMLPTKKVFVKCLHNIFAWHTIVRKFPPRLTASLLLLLPNWSSRWDFMENGNRGWQFGDTHTKNRTLSFTMR